MTDAPRNALLVEDNPDDEKLTIRELARAKLKNRVDVARDGQEAIDYLLGSEKHAARPLPAVVLLKLAKVGSLEILRRIRAEKTGPTDCRSSPRRAQTSTPTWSMATTLELTATSASRSSSTPSPLQ